MTKKISPSCVFENERVTFKSYIHEFTQELFEEFESKAEKIGLHSKIDDLLTGKKVNYTNPSNWSIDDYVKICEPIDNTKLFWALMRCQNSDPSKRYLLWI